ncbi:MAG: N-terminal phage integrase SAM-like domain-containing protein [Isosphaeraceae bacterium]
MTSRVRSPEPFHRARCPTVTVTLEAGGTTEAEILADDWINPDAGRIPFGDYADQWIDERPDLRPKTVELYRYLLRRHLVPTFGTRAMADIKEPHVRRWRKTLLEEGQPHRHCRGQPAGADGPHGTQQHPC